MRSSFSAVLAGTAGVWIRSLLCAVLFVGHFSYQPADFVLEISVRTQSCTYLQLFYDAGKGYRQQDSSTRLADSRKKFTVVRFDIHAHHVNALQLSLLRGPGSIELRDIVLRDARRNTKIAIPLSSLGAVNGIATLATTGSAVRVATTPAAGGATVGIQLPRPLHARDIPDWRAVLLTLALALSLAWLIALDPQAHLRAAEAANKLTATWWIIGGLLLLYAVASCGNFNGSSAAIWQFYGDGKLPHAGILVGSAKEIRSDEWMVQTPWIFSQAKQAPPFPIVNRNVGSGVAPLLTNLPARHWTMLFRPQMWGFFCLTTVRGFALNWNFKWFALLLSSFLFFKVLTRGDWIVALGGALFLFFSAFNQWWFTTPTCMPEMVAMTFFGLWSLTTLFRSASRVGIVASSLVLLVAVEQFVFCCYPRFQVPLVYLAAALALGLALDVRKAQGAEPLRRFRVVCLTSTILIAGALLGRWCFEVAGTLREMADLIYPGRVFSTGGTFPWSGFFAPFLEFTMTEDHYPAGFVNVCDAAGFLFFAPLLIALIVRQSRRRRPDPVLLAVSIFLGFNIWFMAVGVPPSLAKLTGWSYVTSSRAMLALGVATTVALVRYLGGTHASVEEPKANRRWLVLIVLTIGLAVLLALVNKALGSFASGTDVAAAAIFFAVACFCLWSRLVVATCVLLVVPLIYATALVNPISRGLPAMTSGKLFHWIEGVARKSPRASWLVAGSSVRSYALAQLVKATGAEVLNGTRCTPDGELLRRLDPNDRAATVHDRYARVCFVPADVATPAFKLWAIDAYTVELPLTGSILVGLGVDDLLLIDQFAAGGLDGFKVIGEKNRCYLYQRDRSGETDR